MGANRYRKRAFLNKDLTKRAYVIACVEGVEGWKSERKGFEQESFHMDASLEIGDCTKTVYLDFNISDPAQKANVLHKVKLLREVVNNFLDQVEAEAAKSDFKIKKTKVLEPSRYNECVQFEENS